MSERSALMLRQLDSLEADLHTESSEITTYGSLVDRHGHAEQVACQVTDEHVREITRLDLAQKKKREEKLKKRRAVASAGTHVGQRLASR